MAHVFRTAFRGDRLGGFHLGLSRFLPGPVDASGPGWRRRRDYGRAATGHSPVSVTPRYEAYAIGLGCDLRRRGGDSPSGCEGA